MDNIEDVISIIVPIYNVEKYLTRCVDSLINQSYKELEIILVDDGSPDNCGDICDKYVREDTRIKVIHKENGGLSDARNAGLDMLTGNYVMFVDSDDWISRDLCEVLLKECKINNADISACFFRSVNEDELFVEDSVRTSYDTKLLTKDEALEIIIFNTDIKENCPVAQMAWGKLYVAELFRSIRFPYGKLHEDEFTTYKVVDKANRCVSIVSPKYFYLKRTNSIMGAAKGIKSYLHSIEAFEERYEYFKERNDNLAKSSFNILIATYLVSYADSSSVLMDGRFCLKERTGRKLDSVKVIDIITKLKNNEIGRKVLLGLLAYKLNKNFFIFLRKSKRKIICCFI